jgi:predicted ATPase
MVPCKCTHTHAQRRVVLTGGPGAGKTAVLELVRQQFCQHVEVLPESASMLMGGGFRRGETIAGKAAMQRAIFHVQRELENFAEAEGDEAITICDRGTIDGFAYWPGPGDFWAAVGANRLEELARYDAVLHLRSPPAVNGYNRQNPLRTETAEEAAIIDQRIAEAWDGHPRRFIIESTVDFLSKAQTAIALLRAELPECCRSHVVSTGAQVR